MYKLSYDLHIHSCLSPCGSDDATPNNLAMLSSLLELDVVALTDHNSCKNCPAFFQVAEEAGIIPIAGAEVTTSEEIHVLSLFPTLKLAMEFDEILNEALLPFENDKEIYGNQFIMDSKDKIIGEEKYCLINATCLDLYTLGETVNNMDGIIIPAHIDRSAFSLISALGTVPCDNGFDCVEIKYPEGIKNLYENHPYLTQCQFIHNSDAHQLDNISLPVNFIEVEEKNAMGVLKALSKSFAAKMNNLPN